MDEQTYFKALKELETHAVGVGPIQAVDDAMRQYAEFTAATEIREVLLKYLYHAVSMNDLGIILHRYVVSGEMLDIAVLSIGTKVHYQPSHYPSNQWENGIVKEILNKMDGVRVVYHCNNDWDNFINYTGILTSLKGLKLGWRF